MQYMDLGQRRYQFEVLIHTGSGFECVFMALDPDIQKQCLWY